MRRFFAGLMIGLIVLTGLLPVTPHDDFGPSHAHAVSISDSNSFTPSGDTPEGQDDPSIVHCSGISHFFTTGTSTQKLTMAVVGEKYSPFGNIPLTHITAPATPPPIL